MSSSSPPAGCGVGYVEPLLVWLLRLFLGHLQFSAACPAAGYPYRVPHQSGLLLQWTFIVGLAVSCYTIWFSTLCHRSFPFRCLPLAGSATFLAPVCWSTPAVEPCCWVGGVFVASLGFLPCAVLFLRGLQLAQLTLLQVPLGIFRSPGVCPSASLVT